MKKIMLLVGLFLFAAVFASAVETVTATGTAKAKIISAATVSHENNRALDFGTIIPGTGAGSVVLTAVDSTVKTDSNLGGRVDADPYSSDHFTMSNLDVGTTYAVSVPATITIKNPENDEMTVTPSLSDSSVTGVTSKEIYVGGTLAVPAGQANGQYQADYLLTVTY